MPLTTHIRPRKGDTAGGSQAAARPGLSAPRAAMVSALVARFRRRCDRASGACTDVATFLASLRAENAPSEVIEAVAAHLQREAREMPWDPGVARGPTPSFAARIAAERAAAAPALAR